MVNTLGKKIQTFRKAMNMSQLELEIAINAASGSISKIESGKTNPTKETILNIAKVFKLTDRQISYLFGLDFSTPEKVLGIINKLTTLYDVDEIMQTFVNEVSEKLEYITVAILLLDEKQNLVAQCYAQNKPSLDAMKGVTKNFKTLYVNKEIDPENLLLISALESRTIVSEDFYQFSRGAISKPLIMLVQKIVSIKQGIAVPMSVRGKPIGVIFFSKQNTQNYVFEIELLEALSRQMSYIIDTVRRVDNYVSDK